MALLPYMKQLPRDYYLKNLPVASVVEPVAPVVEVPVVPITPILGIPLPPPSGGGIPEAPTDGRTYARENADWTDIIDGASY